MLGTVVKLARPTDYNEGEGARFIVSYTKARNLMGDAAEPFEAWPTDGGWQVATGTSARDAQILALADRGATPREIARELGCGAATVNQVIKASKQTSGEAGLYRCFTTSSVEQLNTKSQVCFHSNICLATWRRPEAVTRVRGNKSRCCFSL